MLSNTNNLQTDLFDIDETLAGIITLGQSGCGCNENEKVLYTPRAPELDLHNQIKFSVITRTSTLGGGGVISY